MTLAVVAPTKPRRRAPAKPAEPFTLPHFRDWAAELILDSGERWKLEPFQEAFIADVFAGTAECWLVVPEGNGKTTLVAGLALYHAEFRPHAAIPVAASSREQAEIMYRQAEGFVLRSPRMYEAVRSDLQLAKGKRKTQVPRFVCLEGYRRVNHYAGGRIQVFAADDRTGDGIIPTLGILDELHRHRDLSLYRTWAGKLGKRGGQIVAISTAGEPGSEFETTRARIRQTSKEVIRKGSFIRAAGGAVVLHEWAVSEKAKVEDFKVVKAANPFSGITILNLREKFRSPTMTMGHWLRFVCNRPTRADNAAITEAEWAAAGVDYPAIPKGEPVWLGLDVAWKWDTTAAVPLFWKDDDHRILGVPAILTPPRDGSSLDPNLVEKALLDIHARNPVHTVVMDSSRAEQLGSWIAEELGATVIDRAQTNLEAAQDYEAFMDALRNGWIHHPGDPVLTRHAMNAIARVLPTGKARFDRPSQARHWVAEQEHRVIDALTAAAMVHAAAAEAAKAPAKPKPFVVYGKARA
jgi:phage terminase large subunit-like protein